MNRADKCVWRYRSRVRNSAHAFDLFYPTRPLCRSSKVGRAYSYKTAPETSPVPLCSTCLREMTGFREYASRRDK